MNDSPISRCTKQILFQARQDHATELVIRRSAGTGAAVRYTVAGKSYDWKAPGPEHAPGIIAEIGTLAGFGNKPFPREGLIDLAYSGLRLLWVVRMASAEGDCILRPVEQ